MPSAQPDTYSFSAAPSPQPVGVLTRTGAALNNSAISPGEQEARWWHAHDRRVSAARVKTVRAAVAKAALGPLVKAASWVRTGYPVDAPCGHLALLALAPRRP
jgi:hypothetical protein